jgi:RNA polymerase sigma-70 factor (ECF subfamily)
MDDTDPEQLVRLVAAAAAGDQKAWRDIVERCTPRVHAVVRAQCRDDDLAEEIVQSAFCTVVQKLSAYQEGGRFEAWLLRIAMNRLRDEMRRRGRQAVSTDTSTMVEIAGVPETASSAGGLPGGRLAEALGRLSEADREIIHLRHVGGLSFKEISAALETPIGTLLARHHRALKKMKDLLDQTPMEDRE